MPCGHVASVGVHGGPRAAGERRVVEDQRDGRGVRAGVDGDDRFAVAVLAVDHEGAVEGLRVFYVSQAKERTVGGDDFGAGCGKFMEVTSYFTKKMAGAGFELYTAEQRYVSVVGGIFVLAAFAKDALQVGSVSFMDSRFPELTCE